jgi:hypothetical protein
MSTGRSNTILVSELLSQDGPHGRVADNFVRSVCSGCGAQLTHDPRYGEWGAFCTRCWPDARMA